MGPRRAGRLADLLAVARVLLALAVVLSCAPTAATSASPSATSTQSQPAATAAPTTAPTPPIVTSTIAPVIALAVRRTAVPAEFHYDESWPGRIMLLDPRAGTAAEVVTYVAASSEPGYPRASLSSSRDGRALLVLVRVSPPRSFLYLVTPESGQSRLLSEGVILSALISPDGGRFAVARSEPDPAGTGLWVGLVADGSSTRLASDEAHAAGGPPLPFAFSSDSSTLVFGVSVSDSGHVGALASLPAAEFDAGKLRAGQPVPGITLLDFASGAEFRSDQELFVWSSRTVFGGKTQAYLYDRRGTLTSGPLTAAGELIVSAHARPGTQQFVTLERQICCGVNVPITAWLRERDGSGRVVGTPNGFIGDVWWSRDGSKLYATIGGDDSVGGVTDLLTGSSVMTFCKRGGIAPAGCT